jgi:hypothetical protein
VHTHVGLFVCCLVSGHNLYKIDPLIEPCSHWASFIAPFLLFFLHILSAGTLFGSRSRGVVIVAPNPFSPT